MRPCLTRASKQLYMHAFAPHQRHLPPLAGSCPSSLSSSLMHSCGTMQPSKSSCCSALGESCNSGRPAWKEWPLCATGRLLEAQKRFAFWLMPKHSRPWAGLASDHAASVCTAASCKQSTLLQATVSTEQAPLKGQVMRCILGPSP